MSDRRDQDCRIVRQGSKIFLKLQSASKTPGLSGKGVLLALWSIFWIRVYGWEFYELYWDALPADENKSVVLHRLVQKNIPQKPIRNGACQ